MGWAASPALARVAREAAGTYVTLPPAPPHPLPPRSRAGGTHRWQPARTSPPAGACAGQPDSAAPLAVWSEWQGRRHRARLHRCASSFRVCIELKRSAVRPLPQRARLRLRLQPVPLPCLACPRSQRLPAPSTHSPCTPLMCLPSLHHPSPSRGAVDAVFTPRFLREHILKDDEADKYI